MTVRKQRGGFTLVELLVVISIIGMLMALLIPAVQQARETARSNTCRNNLTNLVKAIINYESTTQSYPGYQQTITARNGHAMQVSWLVPILRQLDRPDIDNTVRSFKGDQGNPAKLPPLGPANETTLIQNPMNPNYTTAVGLTAPSFLEILLCPSDAARAKQGQVSHYVVNTGRADVLDTFTSLGKPIDFPDNGIFHAAGPIWHNGVLDFSGPTAPAAVNLGTKAQKFGSGFVSRGDGLSTTLMLSENAAPHDWVDLAENRTGFVWWPTVEPIDDSATGGQDQTVWKINGLLGQEQPDYDINFARPSAYHPGGVNVAFAGGNVRFVSEEMQYLVYILLMTPSGRSAKDFKGNLWNSQAADWTPMAANFSPQQNPATPLNEQDIIP